MLNISTSGWSYKSSELSELGEFLDFDFHRIFNKISTNGMDRVIQREGRQGRKGLMAASYLQPFSVYGILGDVEQVEQKEEAVVSFATLATFALRLFVIFSRYPAVIFS